MITDSQRLKAALGDRYRIERELGAGGMATVYLATDLKHEREVALKVLRPELAAVLGAERFLAEIRITARLDHPHILTLIDSGEAGGLLYYVLPLVRGESLRAKLEREQQLGIDESLAIARQVASALEYAHQHGVVHRDIKPENILIHEGEAVLADFGIALAIKEAGGHRLTETGLSLGTPQYMSPEQATGHRQLDARSDVYSLGAVLYEMLAGEPPVTGPTAQAMIAKLMTERPTRLRVVRDTVPEAVDAAVARALAKTPADRFAGAAEFVRALASAPVGSERIASGGSRRWIGLAALLALAAAFGSWRVLAGREDTLALGRSVQLTTEAGMEIQPAIAPDGRLVAYAAGGGARMRIFVRPIEGGRLIPLSDDTSSIEYQPRWSPDGRTLLYLTRLGVAVAPALGGSSRPIAGGTPDRYVSAACWSPDGREIAIGRVDSLYIVPTTGGTERFVGRGENLHSCHWSPNGRWIAIVSQNAESVRPGISFGNLAPSAILLFPAAGGDPVRLVEPRQLNLSPVWAADDRLLFLSNRDGPTDIYSLSLTAAGRLRGDPSRLSTGLNAASFSLAGTGDSAHISYAVYSARSNIWSLPIPPGAPITASSAVQLTSGSQVVESMRASRDGRWLLYDSDLRGNADVYRIPIGGGAAQQLTSETAHEFAPDLSPDGRLVAYHSWRSGTRDIEIKPVDGGTIEIVTATPAQESYPVWSPDGQVLLYYDQVRPLAIYLVRRDPAGGWMAPLLFARPAGSGDWSPDGREIVVVATTSERDGPLDVVPAGGGPARRLFTPGPGAPEADHALWMPDGRSIVYKAHDDAGFTSFWSVSSAGGRPRLLVRFTNPDRQSGRRDFTTDGRRLFFAIEERQSDVFIAELRR